MPGMRGLMTLQHQSATDTPARERLLELIAALQDGRPIPPSTASWLHRGAVRFALGETSTLCGALKLRARGHESIRSTELREARNESLRRAFQLHGGSIAAFRKTVTRFAAIAWPRVRELETPPSRLTPVQCELFRAAKHGSIPASEKQLRNIIGNRKV